MRQLIVESAILVIVGASLAFILSTWTLRAVAQSGGLAFITDDDPERLAAALVPNGWAFAFAVLLSAVSIVACGLVPALRATRPDLANAIKADHGTFGRLSRSSVRSALTVAQVALSIVLLVAASVLTRSMMRALSFDVGFERAHVLTVASSVRLAGYDSARAQALARALDQRIAELPSVRSVARGDVPVVGGRFRTTLTVSRGAGGENHDGYIAAVTPAYFAAIFTVSSVVLFTTTWMTSGRRG